MIFTFEGLFWLLGGEWVEVVGHSRSRMTTVRTVAVVQARRNGGQRERWW